MVNFIGFGVVFGKVDDVCFYNGFIFDLMVGCFLGMVCGFNLSNYFVYFVFKVFIDLFFIVSEYMIIEDFVRVLDDIFCEMFLSFGCLCIVCIVNVWSFYYVDI